MSKVFFSHDQIQERPNTRFPTPDPHQIHYHFRPARPANFCVTRDRDTGEVNVSAGTIGPLTWNPYTMCLHICKESYDTYRNLKVGSHCVIALPNKDIVKETWITALPLPRGINEAKVAGLHHFDSRWIDIPGIQECPVNFECVVEFFTDYYTHGIFFVRVLGASLDESVLSMDREDVVRWFPTYEVDDIANAFGGSVERLGVMGELFPCPSFPLAAKQGWYQSFTRWMSDLKEEGYLNSNELDLIKSKEKSYQDRFRDTEHPQRKALHDFFTHLSELIIREQWDDLHVFLAASSKD